MAKRPVFISQDATPFVINAETEFKFYSGFAITQSRKSIRSLHESFVMNNPEYRGLVLEVSSKSENSLGVRLSAFNLMYSMNDGTKHYLENVFQSGKCFSNGKQYMEILKMSAAEAKHFPGLRTSGNVVKFSLEGKEYPIEPRTFFYDWIYVNALYQNQNLAEEVIKYRAFTDIAFNPEKSINCQARSAALFVALFRTGQLADAISSSDLFMKIVYDNDKKEKEKKTSFQQMSMF